MSETKNVDVKTVLFFRSGNKIKLSTQRILFWPNSTFNIITILQQALVPVTRV